MNDSLSPALEITLKSGQAEKQRAGCLIVGVYENKKLSQTAEILDKASEGYITNLLKRGDLEGKKGQTLLLPELKGIAAERVLLVGCGKAQPLKESEFKEVMHSALQAVKATSTQEAVSYLTELAVQERDLYWKIRFSIEAIFENIYQFQAYKSKKKDTPKRALKRLVFAVPTRRDLSTAEHALNEGLALAEAVAFIKDLGNTPANICTPTYLAKEAERLAKSFKTLSCAVLEAKQIEALGMNAFLAVAKGSLEAPKLITLEYRPNKAKNAKPVVFVGKGITFDTGGYSLKTPYTNMVGMKYDICGAATVLGVMQAAAQLELPLHLVGVIPTCENMVSGDATRPDDIVTTLSGQTVEILNTDAEGRLILCDALSYVERFDPEAVIDIATLTGACVVALGRVASGLLGNNPELVQSLLTAGQNSMDRAWELPLWEEYHEGLKSNFADLANIGGDAGTITAASFLSAFTKKYAWAHLDVAGTAAIMGGKDKMATGRPLPLLLQYLLNRCSRK